MTEAEQTARRGTTRLSKRRRAFFAGLTILLSLAALAAVEGLLRFAGLGGYRPFFREIPLAPHTALVVTDKAGSSGYFFMNRDKPGTNDEFAFLDPKPGRAFRVFLAGGSTIKGFPQPIAFSAASFLQAMLRDLWPNRRVEVINLGATAVASFPVLDIVRQAVRHDPDLVIIYSGHNEFFGAYGVASANRASLPPRMLPWLYRLRGLALVQGLGACLPGRRTLENKTLMEFMAGKPYIAPADPARRRAARDLRYNLRAMAAACRARHIPIVLCTLPSNERDIAPLGRAAPGALDDPARKRLAARFEQARADLAEAPATAARELEAVLRRAPLHAPAHYNLARARAALGEHEQARAHYTPTLQKKAA